MADNDTALRKVAALVSAALRNGPPALEDDLCPVAFLLGADALAGPEATEKALRQALGLAPGCRCGITPGTPSEVVPYACPVHGTPCDECGGLEACKPGCGGGYTPVDSGTDADGTPWAVVAGGGGLVVSVGREGVLLKGGDRDRYAEAVARAVTPGQAEAAQAAGTGDLRG